MPRETIGDEIHATTKHYRGQLGGGGLDWGHKPHTYKRYLTHPG